MAFRRPNQGSCENPIQVGVTIGAASRGLPYACPPNLNPRPQPGPPRTPTQDEFAGTYREYVDQQRRGPAAPNADAGNGEGQETRSEAGEAGPGGRRCGDGTKASQVGRSQGLVLE